MKFRFLVFAKYADGSSCWYAIYRMGAKVVNQILGIDEAREMKEGLFKDETRIDKFGTTRKYYCEQKLLTAE